MPQEAYSLRSRRRPLNLLSRFDRDSMVAWVRRFSSRDWNRHEEIEHFWLQYRGGGGGSLSLRHLVAPPLFQPRSSLPSASQVSSAASFRVDLTEEWRGKSSTRPATISPVQWVQCNYWPWFVKPGPELHAKIILPPDENNPLFNHGSVCRACKVFRRNDRKRRNFCELKTDLKREGENYTR